MQVRLTVEGPAAVEGEALRRVEVPSGAERTVHFSVRTADREGEVRFLLAAEGAGERARAEGAVAVRPDLPPRTVEEAGALSTQRTDLPFAPAAGPFRPGTERRTLRVGALPLVQFSGKLEGLLRYPYGCLEQTVSVAFPLIYLGDLARELEPELLDPAKGRPDPAALVQEAVRRAATMQVEGGGFALWPGEEGANAWASVHATHFLVEARRAGHPVEERVIDHGLTWLQDHVRARASYSSGELERSAYALYVLARGGRADTGTMDFLRQRQGKNLRPESRALLAAAYAATGSTTLVGELTTGLQDVQEVERQSGQNLDSVIRNRALLLLALLDAAPGHSLIPALADRLARDARQAGEWTTQEAGLALLALGQLFQRQAAKPPFSGSVFAGERRLGAFDSRKPAVFAGIEGSAPLRIVIDGGYQAGSAFYSLLTSGVPTDEAFRPVAAGLEVERQLLGRDGVPLSGAVEQGTLVVLRTRVRSTVGPLENVVVENRLPSGLEVENPRLETTEALPWIEDAAEKPAHLDLRDDRILLFLDLPDGEPRTYYALARAVSPGSFRLPPPHAQAMYNPALSATGERGRIEVKVAE